MQANIENCAESPLDNRLNPIKLEREDPNERSDEVSSTIRHRRPVLNDTTYETKLIDKDDKAPKKLLDKFSFSRIFRILLICLVPLLMIFMSMRYGKEISQNKTLIFQNIVNLADSGSKKLSSLEIPETSEMSGYRVVIRDLGVIMEKSDIIVKNGKKISEVLFGLDKEIEVAGDELDEFRHQAKKFFYSLASEMKAITQEIENSQWAESGVLKFFIKSNSHLLSNNATEFIYKRLEVLENQIPGFQEQLKRVLSAIFSVHNSADNTHGYLIDGEREAERALKKHWLGNIADSTVRNRAEDELLRVRIIIKMLKEITPSLLKFEKFLKEYRRNLQDVAKEVQNIPTKPTAEDMKYLKKAVADLEEQHTQFSSAKKQYISMDAYLAKYREESETLEEQRTKFSSEEYKPVDTYEDAKDEDIKDDEENAQSHNHSMLYAYLENIAKWIYSIITHYMSYAYELAKRTCSFAF
ncbi:21030_t:CDS:2 [Dentiscutata erythropus]|uniref:21030_t:CDS:1 n=1 Tax=Dentiscutata erythropus TaxID=1348616 RepID=A0A9N9IL77_9GLOM|nr:21030_t:CDS:2 [Dentiscutata erythropus]